MVLSVAPHGCRPRERQRGLAVAGLPAPPDTRDDGEETRLPQKALPYESDASPVRCGLPGPPDTGVWPASVRGRGPSGKPRRDDQAAPRVTHPRRFPTEE